MLPATRAWQSYSKFCPTQNKKRNVLRESRPRVTSKMSKANDMRFADNIGPNRPKLSATSLCRTSTRPFRLALPAEYYCFSKYLTLKKVKSRTEGHNGYSEEILLSGFGQSHEMFGRFVGQNFSQNCMRFFANFVAWRLSRKIRRRLTDRTRLPPISTVVLIDWNCCYEGLL